MDRVYYFGVKLFYCLISINCLIFVEGNDQTGSGNEVSVMPRVVITSDINYNYNKTKILNIANIVSDVSFSLCDINYQDLRPSVY